VDIKFNCTSCGTHIVIDEAGAGMAVQCPRCYQPLTVPPASATGLIRGAESAAVEPGRADTTAGKLGLHGGFGEIVESAIQSAAKGIESGILADAQKLDEYLRRSKPEVLAANFGKKQANDFLDGRISGSELVKSDRILSPEAFARLKSQFDAIK